MKLLKDILYGARLEEVNGSTNLAVEDICLDSREVGKYSVFVAIKGTQTDGHEFIASAIERGAVAIVCEEMPEAQKEGVTYVRVNSTPAALGIIASNFYDEPSEKIHLVGVTGTNGKTTVATLLFRLFRELGYECGLISTVENRIGNEVIPSTHTTPDAVGLNRLLNEMVERGCEFCFMEVSSHAVHQERISGLKFKGAIFTNISHDHLDYHGTFENYMAAKKGFFDRLTHGSFALYNKDDYHWEEMASDTRGFVRTFGIHSPADFKAKVLENQFSGLQLNIDGRDLWSQLIGGFNAYNILAVYGAAMCLDMDQVEILTAISQLNAPEGRFQYVKTPDNITAVVDYAHTPDALKNVLNTIQNIRSGAERVITVVGCGGDRDKTKRPVMAQIATDMSDQVVLTSDNPRTEDPDAIIREMEAGLDPVQKKKTLAITSRREGIRTACTLAQPGDIILVAGKGHEKYQEINGVRHDFDDLEVLKETLKTIEE